MSPVFSWLVVIGAGAVALMVSWLCGLFLGWLADGDRERWRASMVNRQPPRLL